MKILVISHSAILKVNQFLYEELTNRGHQINVIVPKTWSSGGLGKNHTCQKSDKVNVIPCDTTFTGNGSLYFLNVSLTKIIKKISPDAIFLDEEPWSFVAFQTLFTLLKFKKIKLITYTKQNIYKKYPWPFHLIERWCYRRSNILLSIGEECSDVLKRKGYQGIIRYFPHAVDLKLFSFDPKERSFNERLSVGYIGRFIEAKGGADLIRAISLLKQKSINVELTFLGGGEDEGKWLSLARDLNVQDRVNFRPALAHLEIPKGYQSFDVICLPSRTTSSWKEQFGRVIIEAAATGRPVIGSDSGEIPHVINSLNNGLVFSEGSSEDLAEKINQLIERPELYHSFVRNGRSNVEELYTYSALADEFENCLSR